MNRPQQATAIQPDIDTQPSESLEATQSPPPASSNSKGKRKASGDDDGEGGEDEPAPKGTKKRNRKPVTCAQCRRRKLKCDRGYPCGACRDRQEGHLCEWEGAIRLPQPHLTRDAEAQELRTQLDRLEGLLGALGSNPAAVALLAAGGGGVGGQGVAEKSAAEALGLLAANPASPVASTSKAGQRASPAAAATIVQYAALLPQKKELDAIINRFLTSELLFFPIVHTATFQARLAIYSIAVAAEEPHFLALLLAIVAFEMSWQLNEPGLGRQAAIEKETAAKRYVEASREVLAAGGFMEAPNLDVVRTLLVLYRCAEQQLDARGGFYLSQGIQIAQSLGLNRDPGAFGGFNHIEVEERRRLWQILLGLDWLDQSGRLSTITTTQYDTQPPTNAYDNDITLDGVISQPFPSFTPILFGDLLSRISVWNQAMSEDVYAVKPKELLTWARVEELNAGLEGLLRSLPTLEWVGDAVKPLEQNGSTSSNSASDRFRVEAHSTLLRLTIRLNRPFLSRGCADSRFKQGRDKVIDAAHKLLGIFLGYPVDHAISRLPSVTFHALNSMLLCALDLFQDPAGPHADKHRRLLGAVSTKFTAREYRPAIITEVVRVVSVLLRTATKPTLMRQTSISVSSELDSLSPDFVFAGSLPLPMTVDPFALLNRPAKKAGNESDLATLWDPLVAQFKHMYAVPDRREWTELAKVGTRPWEGGVDLTATSA